MKKQLTCEQIIENLRDTLTVLQDSPENDDYKLGYMDALVSVIESLQTVDEGS